MILEAVGVRGLTLVALAGVEIPGASEDRTIFWAEEDLTIRKLRAVLRGAASSVDWTIRHGPDRGAAGTELVTGGSTTSSTTSGDTIESFDSADILADSWMWLETTAVSGTPQELAVEAYV